MIGDPIGWLAGVAVRRRAGIVLWCTLGLVAAALLGRLLPPSYEASVQLVIGKSWLDGKNWLDKDQTSGRTETTLNTEVQIAKSEEVLRAAVTAFGAERLYPGIKKPSAPSATTTDAAILRVASAYGVKTESGADVMRLTFRHKDREAAAEFANLLAEKFVLFDAEMQRRSGATEMLVQIKRRQDEAFREISAKLSKFSVTNNVFSVGDQRTLLLGRESGIKGALAQAQSAIAEKQAMVVSVSKQLAQMKVSTNSQSLANTVAKLGRAGTTSTPDGGSAAFSADAPVVLIKIYQDAVQMLVKYNAELDGLIASLEKQKISLSSVQTELASLSRDESVFHELSHEAAIARTNAETTAKRVAEQQLQDEVNAASMSAVRIMQKAQPPIEAVSPRLALLLPLGLLLGSLVGLLAAGVREIQELRLNMPYAPADDGIVKARFRRRRLPAAAVHPSNLTALRPGRAPFPTAVR